MQRSKFNLLLNELEGRLSAVVIVIGFVWIMDNESGIQCRDKFIFLYVLLLINGHDMVSPVNPMYDGLENRF